MVVVSITPRLRTLLIKREKGGEGRVAGFWKRKRRIRYIHTHCDWTWTCSWPSAWKEVGVRMLLYPTNHSPFSHPFVLSIPAARSSGSNQKEGCGGHGTNSRGSPSTSTPYTGPLYASLRLVPYLDAFLAARRWTAALNEGVVSKYISSVLLLYHEPGPISGG